MELAEGIRRIGFRRWHERQLLQCHLYLVSALLCLIAVLATVEGFASRSFSLTFFIGLLLIIAGTAAGVWAFGRYVKMMVTAQYVADRSICSRCKTYGVLEAPESSRHAVSPEREIAPTPVRCRVCGNEWTIQ